ncbi:MAG: hypothetical protein ABGZ19_02765 [Verrucomicrobiales bacterium]|nr:hypothetical protein [Methyloprofundus sp.]HIL79249.1 hypothetical protein [Methylococcales bacterium]
MAQGIDYFNREHWLSNIQEEVSFGARKRMFDTWLDYGQGLDNNSLLDVGATPDVERADSNCFLKWFHEKGMQVACYSPENINHLNDLFPFIDVLQGDFNDQQLPVSDIRYDWCASSAVLEHVGSLESQIQFVSEHARVAKSLFLTTPNRYHWLEFHTKIPFIHWLPRNFHRLLLKIFGLNFWASEKNLRLVGKEELSSIAQVALGDEWDFEIRTVSTLGMQSNLLLLASRRNHNNS